MRHTLETLEKGYRCTVCERTWQREPSSHCPGVKQYEWGKWGENLLTKKQMSDAGLQTGKKLPAPAGAVPRADSPGGWMWLYDKAQGVPKKVMSEAQKAAVAKAAEVARIGWTCKRCGWRLRWYVAGGGLCGDCQMLDRIDHDHREAAGWARRLLAGNFLILDTETTGLDSHYNEIIEISVVSVVKGQPETLLNTYIKPDHPERMYERGGYRDICAHDVHGISEENLKAAPSFCEVYMQLREMLRGQLVVIYNAAFDTGMLVASCDRYALPRLSARYWICAMEWHAQWYGDYSKKRGYRWQPLNGGHSANADCLAVLDRLQTMATWKETKLDEILQKETQQWIE